MKKFYQSRKSHTSLIGQLNFRLMTACLCTLAFVFAAEVNGQTCTMFCPDPNTPVQVSLGADCLDTLTAADLGANGSAGCSGPFTVEIMQGATSYGNLIDETMLGQEFMVIVTDQGSGNLCMASILVLDKQPPIVNCLSDTAVSCFTNLDSIPGMTEEDVIDCSPVNIYSYDELVFSGVCSDDTVSKYNRYHIIVDSENNADTCIQMIWMLAVDIDSTVFPPNFKGPDALPCVPAPDLSPENTGYPTVEGFPIINGQVCNLSATYEDVPVDLCSGGYKILRTWTVYDWCNDTLVLDSLQVIEVMDFTPPEIDLPDTLHVAAGDNCEADVILPEAGISEDCSDPLLVDVTMVTPIGTIESNGGLVPGLPTGVYSVLYIATNDCGKMAFDTLIVVVEDLSLPTPVCKQGVVVPLNQEGMAVVPASALNAGSNDNCGPVFFKARRMDAPLGYECTLDTNPNYLFDDKFKLCCEDISNGPVMIVLRIYDLQPVPGPVAEDYLDGHFVDCMVSVEAQDKLPPSITCPPDLTISCEFPFDPENLSVFGEIATHPAEQSDICLDDPGNPESDELVCYGTDGLALDNCNVIVEEGAAIFVDTLCGTGTITRTFTATDDGGLTATCVQTITIIDFTPFTEGDITWPQDFNTENICEVAQLHPDFLSAPYDYPALATGSCQIVTATFSDTYYDFSITGQACFKILREWSVIDWCQYDPETGAGLWTDVQILKSHNTIAPDFTIDIDDVTVCTDDAACGPGNHTLEASADDDCTNALSLEWQVYVDLNNDNSFDIPIPVMTGAMIQVPVVLPLGTHRILYVVEDLCSNTSTTEQFVTMVSCKPPSAKCQNINASLMPMDTDGDFIADWGMIEIHASQIDAGSDHLCGNPVSLAFSSDPSDTLVMFDCEDLGPNPIQLWVIDNNGNTDFCTATIIIQDNSEVCPPADPLGSGIIGGKLFTDAEREIKGVKIDLTGTGMDPQYSDNLGTYVFPDMPFGGSYSVRPWMDVNDKNGISSLDLLQIQKHLLGIEKFNSPYKYIAADANNSGSVSATDIIELRKLVLGIYTELPKNDSWRFIDAAYNFPDPANPFSTPIPDTYEIQPFTTDMNAIDFIGVKIGDLNHSAYTQLQGGEDLEIRTSNKLYLFTDEVNTEANQISEIPIYIQNPDGLEALQFTINFDTEKFGVVDIKPGEMGGELYWNTDMLATGKIGVSWFSVESRNIEENVPFLILKVRSGVSAAVSQVIGIGSELVEMESHNSLTGYMNIVWRVQEGEALASEDLEVLQNRPNPFNNKTIIPFILRSDENVNIRIYNNYGMLVYESNGNYNKGYNQIEVSASDLGSAGIYMYEINTNRQSYTNRMIIARK